MGKQETLETIWEAPDELWERIEPIILEEDPPKARGRKRSDPRQMLNGIIFRLRSGCQWNRLPKELGDDSTIHRTFQRWVGTGVLHRMWGALVEGCEELDGWTGNGRRQTEPWARHVLGGPDWAQPYGPWQGWYQGSQVDGEGGPLSIVVAGANVHDAKLFEATLDAIVVERPQPTGRNPNTCVWTKGMTILQAVGLPPDTAIGSTSDASARRSWTPLATSGIRRAGGLWNGRWHGSPSAVRSWSGTTRRQRTTSVCYSSHVRSCGSGDSGVWPF